jgi:YqaJ-like viral recombinase domain
VVKTPSQFKKIMQNQNRYLSFEELQALYPEAVKDFEKQVKSTEQKDEFIQNRLGVFTASEIFKLFTPKFEIADNETARKYIAQKAYEKATRQRATAEIDAPSLRWGKQYEGEAITNYIELTGNMVHSHGEEQVFFAHDELDAGCYPDGLIKNGVLEVKCPYNGSEHLQNLMCGKEIGSFKKLRFEYYLQTQFQLWVTGREVSHFVSYRPDIEGLPKIHVIVLPRDEFVIHRLDLAVRGAMEQRDAILSELSFEF